MNLKINSRFIEDESWEEEQPHLKLIPNLQLGCIFQHPHKVITGNKLY